MLYDSDVFLTVGTWQDLFGPFLQWSRQGEEDCL